jgi:hypothetical protein
MVPKVGRWRWRGAARGALCLLVLAGPVFPQDTKYPPLGEGVPGPDFCGEAGFLPLGGQIPGPATEGDWGAWLADLKHWRAERLIRAGYDPGEYERPELAWTQSSIVQYVVMAHDRFLYDPQTREYTVGRPMAISRSGSGSRIRCSSGLSGTSASTIAINTTSCAICPGA